MTVSGGYVYVTVTDPEGPALDPETVRFGTPGRVNRARAATPVSWAGSSGDETVFVFDATDLDAWTGEVKLFGKRRGTRKPVTGETSI